VRLTEGTGPYGAMGRSKGTRGADRKVGRRSPKINSRAYKKGFMPKNKPRGVLNDNY
jgi:hypothetical protein